MDKLKFNSDYDFLLSPMKEIILKANTRTLHRVKYIRTKIRKNKLNKQEVIVRYNEWKQVNAETYEKDKETRRMQPTMISLEKIGIVIPEKEPEELEDVPEDEEPEDVPVITSEEEVKPAFKIPYIKISVFLILVTVAANYVTGRRKKTPKPIQKVPKIVGLID